MKPTATILFVSFALVFFAGAQPSAADAADMSISSLVVVPGTIKLERFDRSALGETNVIARVTDAGRIPADLELTYTNSPGLKVEVGDRVAKAGDIEWPVRISVAGDPPDTGVVDFRLAYESGGESSAAKIEVQRASLAVQVEPGREASPAGDADVSIRTDSTEISEDVPIKAYLTVENKSNQALSIESLDIKLPDFLQAKSDFNPTVLAGHDVLSVPLEISVAADQKPKIGEWLILATVKLARGGQLGIAVKDLKVKVGVPGVSDVLKIFDLPNLLLIPGALVLATWSLLLGASAAKKWLEWKSVNFWLVAITLSIAIFGAQSYLGIGPNFRAAYGVRDVAGLWLVCVGLGVSSFLAFRGSVWSWKHFQAWRAERERQARELLATDEPIDTLRKLLAQELAIYMPRYEKLPDGKVQQIFKTGFKAPDSQVWIVPKMQFRQAPGGPDATDLMSKIASANNQATLRPAALVELLQEGLNNQAIAFEWEKGAVDRPSLMPAGTLGISTSSASPIEYLA